MSTTQNKKSYKLIVIINDFVEKHNQYSGRDIKSLLKLANLKAKAEKTEINVGTIEFITRFHPTLIKPELQNSKNVSERHES